MKAGQFYANLKEAIILYNKRWSVSLDTYDEETVFVVVHGIRDPQEVETLKNNEHQRLGELKSKENFVTLASQYRNYLKNKNWINKSK
jgi:hypothetical protein